MFIYIIVKVKHIEECQLPQLLPHAPPPLPNPQSMARHYHHQCVFASFGTCTNELV